MNDASCGCVNIHERQRAITNRRVVHGFIILRNLLWVNRMRMPLLPVSRTGHILWWTGAARIYEDGDGFSVVFRKWHPVTWVLFFAMIPVCAFWGEKILDVVPMRVGSFFWDHPDELIWWSPFSARQGLICQLPAVRKKDHLSCTDGGC